MPWNPLQGVVGRNFVVFATYIFIILKLFPLETNLFNALLRFIHKHEHLQDDITLRPHLAPKTAATVMVAIIKAPTIFFHILSPSCLCQSHDRWITVHKDWASFHYTITNLNNCTEKQTAAVFYKRYSLPFPKLVLCVSVSFSSPHSLGLLQTPSDNDVANSIMGVNTCVVEAGGGREESADVSAEWGVNMRLKVNLWDRRMSSATHIVEAGCISQVIASSKVVNTVCQMLSMLLKSYFSKLI